MDHAVGPNDLQLTRRLKAPRAAVWRCWTEPALMERWFCPRPWRATDIRMDLRPGGIFATVIRGPEGEVFDEAPGSFLQIVPETRLVWTAALGPGWRPNPIAPDSFAMTAIITLRDDADGGTVYTARVLHATPEAKAKHEAMGFHDGWGAAAGQLDEAALAAS